MKRYRWSRSDDVRACCRCKLCHEGGKKASRLLLLADLSVDLGLLDAAAKHVLPALFSSLDVLLSIRTGH